MKNKIIVAVFVVLMMVAIAGLPFVVHASGNHEHTTVNNTTVVIPQTFTQRVYADSSGTALAIATSQLICDAGTKKSQVSVGVGVYDDSEAFSFGGCKSISNFTIRGSVGKEDNEVGYGFGASWKF